MNIKRKRSVPFIKQMEQYECGICCLAMILSFYHHEINLNKLRQMITCGRDGINLLTLKKAAISFNLDCQGKKAPAESLHLLDLPAILYWEGQHYVVLEKVKNNKYFVIDPMVGKIKLTLEEIKTKYSGYALTVVPNEKFQHKNKDRSQYWSYFKVFLKERKLLTCLFLFALSMQLISLLIPALTKYLVDTAVDSKHLTVINLVSLAMLASVLFQLFFKYIHDRLLIKLQIRIDRMLMERFVSHLLSLPYKFFESRLNGDLVLRTNSHETIRRAIINQLISGSINIMVLSALLVYMLMQSILLTVIVVTVGSLQIFITLMTQKKQKQLSLQEIATQSKENSYLTEAIYGISVIKPLGLENETYDKWNILFNSHLEASRKRSMVKLYIDICNHALEILVPVIIIWIGIHQIVNGIITVGTLFAFQALAISFLSPLNNLANSFGELAMIESLLDRIFDILDTPKEKNEGLKIINHLKGDIRLENVSFRYDPMSPLVLKDINLHIPAGKKVAIVGESGSGKSTLAALLTGLYEPTDGTIYFDRDEIRSIDKISLRKKLGVVTQNNILFCKSIFDNISMGNMSITYDDVIYAAKIAAIHDDIVKMPMGYDTILSENATNLSGGQKQRIALARALVNKPSILLLDEATSALDTVTETQIEKNISKLQCTRIIIAHRLSTIVNADLIIVMREGRIVAKGNHEELLFNEEYRRFYMKKNKQDELITCKKMPQ